MLLKKVNKIGHFKGKWCIMSDVDPLKKTKEEFSEIISKISSESSAVGIDAPYTHAIIISYLQKINERLDLLEKTVNRNK